MKIHEKNFFGVIAEFSVQSCFKLFFFRLFCVRTLATSIHFRWMFFFTCRVQFLQLLAIYFGFANSKFLHGFSQFLVHFPHFFLENWFLFRIIAIINRILFITKIFYISCREALRPWPEFSIERCELSLLVVLNI